MQLSFQTFLIVCPMLFLAGLIDSIGGGGGLISLPAYLFAGLPIHSAIATNKLSSACGTSLSTIRYIKNRLVNAKLAIPSVAFAILGSSIGARLSLQVDDRVLKYVLFAVLPIAAFFVLNRHLFPDHEEEKLVPDRKMLLTAVVAAFVIGIYDGFYGPGTGTFLIIAFTVFAKMGANHANAHTKVINLTTNVTSLVIFLINGQVLIPLGLAAAVFNMAGNYIGSGLVLSKGTKIIRPIILAVLVLLFIKILLD